MQKIKGILLAALGRHGAVALLVALVCVGCASSPFYNEARDKQGQAARKATSEVGLVAVFDTLETRYAALGEAEIATHKDRLATNRDFEIALIAVVRSDTATPSSLQVRYVDSVLDRRLKDLLGSVPDVAKLRTMAQAASVDAHNNEVAASALAAFSAASKLRVTSCPEARRIAADEGSGQEIAPGVLAQVAPKLRSSVNALWGKAIQKCGTGSKPDSDGVGGIIGSLRGELKKDETVLATHHNRLRVAMARLGELTRLHSKQANALAPLPDDSGYRARLARVSDDLASALASFRIAAKADETFERSHAESLVQLESLETILGALGSGVSDPAKLSDDQRGALMFVRLIPKLADEADKLLKDAQRPRLGPFLLAREHQRLVAQGFAANVEFLERRVVERDHQLKAAIAEAKALAQARLVLMAQEQGASDPVDLAKSMSQIADGPSVPAKYLLLRSFAYCFDEAFSHRVDHEVLGLKIQAMRHEQELVQSKASALMWESLLNNMAAILADHHAAGIKPAELAEFLKAFGLINIGARVAH